MSVVEFIREVAALKKLLDAESKKLVLLSAGKYAKKSYWQAGQAKGLAFAAEHLQAILIKAE